MYKDLPKKLQECVKGYLESNQFCKAKAVHDAWMAEKELIQERRRRPHGQINACRVQ